MSAPALQTPTQMVVLYPLTADAAVAITGDRAEGSLVSACRWNSVRMGRADCDR